MKELALVTGGGGGIGAAICRALAPEYRLLVAGRNAARLQAVAEEVGATPLELDVTDSRRSQKVAAEHDIRCLIAGAGFGRSGPVGAADAIASLRSHLETNFIGAVRLVELLVPRWKESGGGRVVFIASSAALDGYPYVSAYAASKHALLGYARSAAKELARHRIAIQILCPHYVDTPMTAASVARICETTGRTEAEARASLAQKNPGGRLITPREVAEATLELLRSPRTGVVLELVGGDSIEREPGLSLD